MSDYQWSPQRELDRQVERKARVIVVFFIVALAAILYRHFGGAA